MSGMSINSKTIRITLLGEDEYVSLAAFLDAASDVKDMLRALGPAVSQTEGNGLEWGITNLYKGSVNIEIACVTNPIVGAAVVQTFVDGMEMIQQAAQRPPLFDDYVLDKAKHLSTIINRDGIARIALGSGQQEIHVSQHIAANVDTLIGVRYEDVGAVEGRLEGINVHDRYLFTVYDSVSGRGIRCSFSDELLDEVVAALRHRVTVHGMVRTDAQGEPISVRVERIERMRLRTELPAITELRGIDPDFSGGVDGAEYIRIMRDAT